MPVFEGPQGLKKSTALKIIGGDYFAEIHESIMNKDFYIALAGKMLCEISELHAFKTADIERIKGIISNASDRYRTPYGQTATDHPRCGVFAGTTNRDDWNTDDTGARRFWPVTCGDIQCEWLTDNREQLFAEAVERFRDGEPWWNVPEIAADVERSARRDVDPWEYLITEYLRVNAAVRIPYLITEVLGLKPRDIDHGTQRRLGKILRQRGYKNTLRRNGTDVIREWIRPL
jgi:predicted P-loop ATPase